MRRTTTVLSAVLLALAAFAAHASGQVQPPQSPIQQQYIGRPIAEVRLELGGRVTNEVELRNVLETRAGRELSMLDVRESLVHLMALSRFENIEVRATADPRGVILIYTLIPLRTVRSIDFRGPLGLDEGLLRSEVRDRYGSSPPLGRADDIARSLEGLYRDHGYGAARVTPHVEFAQGTRVTLAFEVAHGPRAVIGAVRVEGDGRVSEREVLTRLAVKPGAPYDPSEVTRRTTAFEDALRGRGYYQANIEVTPRFLEDTTVNLDISAVRGPKVVVQFTGDPLPSGKADALVRIDAEKSVDRDLLEDWSANIVRDLQTQGYRNAEAPFTSEERDGLLHITFNVRQGVRHLVDAVDVVGNQFLSREQVILLFGVAREQPVVDRAIEAGAAALTAHYRREGFAAAKIQAAIAVRSSTPDGARDVVTVQIAEGVRTTVNSVAYVVNGKETPLAALPVATLATRAKTPFFQPTVTADRNELLLAYLNQGYEAATVSVADESKIVSADRTRADVRFEIQTGPRVTVDQVLIVGNNRTKASTIRNELQLKAGDPMALDKLRASEQRLSALGLFRRVRVTELQSSGDTRDVLVVVDEAPATSIAYGGGLEGAKRLRRDAAGNAVSAIELAPRGLFEIGRRNLFGRNRSVNFSSSVAVRPQSSSVVGTGLREYRAIGTYREPSIFGGLADLLVTGGVEQTVRTSYSFNRRSVYAQATHRVSTSVSVYGRYSIERTNVFSEQVSPEERLLIDIRFPQVRISRLASSIVRDTRDEALDPSSGVLASVEVNVAPRIIGSEVGFAKTLAQGFIYRRLPIKRRIVFAGGARLGLATGFAQTTSTGDIVRDVPISERFFSGNSVRGFVEDRLGRPDTLTPEGFPKGGNGVLILNGELRTSIWKSLVAVTFVDAGNVFLRASEVDPTKMRPAVGFGFRYKSPLGPIRLDIGFNPSRRLFENGTREPLTSLYFGIGQAF